jgi:hypothetical protein
MHVQEHYNRCGSCRHFRPEFTDRMGRTMGECRGKPTHPTVGAQEFGCPAYHLERSRLLPGAPVPDDADLSPRERDLQRRMAAFRAAPPPRQSRPQAVRDDVPESPKLQHIPLDDEGEPMDRDTLRQIFAEVLDEALGTSDAAMHPRYRGGKLIVQPANSELAAKELEVEVLFRKVVGIRDKLRVLEQKINANEQLGSEDKAQLQQYITGCYGSLTSFNYLFRDRDDWFVGQGGAG